MIINVLIALSFIGETVILVSTKLSKISDHAQNTEIGFISDIGLNKALIQSVFFFFSFFWITSLTFNTYMASGLDWIVFSRDYGWCGAHKKHSMYFDYSIFLPWSCSLHAFVKYFMDPFIQIHSTVEVFHSSNYRTLIGFKMFEVYYMHASLELSWYSISH